jgi:hypothetical protein
MVGAREVTTLYRTPNVIIDAHEWHASVETKNGRVYRRFKFRPLSHYIRREMWLPITSWTGRKPKGIGKRFAAFKAHMVQAERSVAENSRAARALVA